MGDGAVMRIHGNGGNFALLGKIRKIAEQVCWNRRQLGEGTRINGMERNDEKGKGRTEGGAEASSAMQLEVMQGPCNPENEKVQGNGGFSEGMSVIGSLCEMEVLLK